MPDNQSHKSPPRSPCADRRAAERYPSDQEASCHPTASLDTTPVLVKDVSTGGVGLVSVRRLEPGTILILELGETALHPVSILARVVHIVALPDGDWQAGCVFLSEVGEHEMAAFRAERKRTPVRSRRAGVRQPTHRVALCRPIGLGSLGKRAAEIRDVSPEGIGLLLCIPFEPGVQLRLEIPAEANDPGRTEHVRVERCEPQPDGRWLLGCRVVPGPKGAAARKTISPKKRK